MTPSAAKLARSEQDEWSAVVTGADDDWLVGLLSMRPDLALARPADLDALAAAVVSPGQLRSWYELTDRTTRQALEALCLLPETTDIDALAGALGTDALQLGPVVDRLAAGGLVLRRGDQLSRNPGLRAAIPHPAGLGPSAREALVTQQVHALADIARRIGAEAKSVKAALIEAIVKVISSSERVAELVAGGPKGTDEICGRMAHDHLQLNLGYGTYQASQSDRTPEGWLLRRALLVPTAWGSAVMPAEVAVALRGGRLFDSFTVAAPAVETTPVDAGQVDRRASEAALALVADVAALLEAWGAEPAKLLQAGGLGVREVRRVAKLTGRSERVAARLVELAAAARLADVNGGLALPTADYDRWLDLPAGARWAWLAAAWRDAPIHLSLAGAIDTKDKPIPALLDLPPEPEAMARRVLALCVLASTAPGDVVDLASLVASLDWRSPVLWQGGPARTERLVAWITEEAELAGVTAGGAMSSFGRHLVDGDDEAAAAALGLLAPPLTTDVVLQADLTAVAAGELAPALRRELDLLADVESTGAATVYRFSEASLCRGIDAGRTSDQILAFLTERAPKGVPQPLAYLVEDLGRRHGRVRIGAARCYVRSDDPAALAEVTLAKKTARLELRLLAPTVAVSGADPAVVERVLREAGYLAATEEAGGTLVVRRPPARRARQVDRPAGLDGLDGLDGLGALSADLLAELSDDPDLLGAIAGTPPAALRSGPIGDSSRLALGEGDGDGPFDLAAMVQRLRNPAPRPVAAAAAPGPRRGAQHRGDLFAQLALLDDEPPRPTQIAMVPAAISELLDAAWEEEWLVRLSYVNGQGGESEFYADVTDLNRRTVSVSRLPKGTHQQLQLSRIRWVRVATEAEEEAQLP